MREDGIEPAVRKARSRTRLTSRRLEYPQKVAFQKWGNNLALRVPKAFSVEIGTSDGKAAEMTVSNGKLAIEIGAAYSGASAAIGSTSWLPL